MNVTTPDIGTDYFNLIATAGLDDIYIQQVFDYYQRCYLENEWAQDFVAHSSRISDVQRANQKIGLCNRSIGKIVPKARSLEGGAIRGGLQHVGLITATGGELFRGCIVIPEFDDRRRIVQATGYRFASRIRHWHQPTINWRRKDIEDFILQGMNLAKEIIHAKAHH